MSFKFKIPEGGERQCAKPQPGAKRGNRLNRQKNRNLPDYVTSGRFLRTKKYRSLFVPGCGTGFLMRFCFKVLVSFFLQPDSPIYDGESGISCTIPPILVIRKIIQLQMVKRGSSTCQLRVASRPVFTISVSLSRFKAITYLTDGFYMVCTS